VINSYYLKVECSKCGWTVHTGLSEKVDILLELLSQQTSFIPLKDGELIPCPRDGSETWRLFNWKGEYIEVSCPTEGCYVHNATYYESAVSVIWQLIEDDKPKK
jgi:ribosomal protein S27E